VRKSAVLLLTVLLLLGTLLRSLLAACAALLLVLARALVLVAHLTTTLLALLILATLLLVAALAALLLLLPLSRLGLATLLSGLATLLLSHCCLQVQVAAGCRMDKAAIRVPRIKVGGMASVRHTGSPCETSDVPRFTTHAGFSREKGGTGSKTSTDVGACSWGSACRTDFGKRHVGPAGSLERSLQSHG